MRIIGVIPSRWGSTRFPGKSLHPICGKPLVQWVVESVKRARLLDEVIVATDDERIASAVKGFVKVAMTRSDHPSGTDRVAEAAQPQDDDIVINIQGDEPLINPDLIDALAKRMKEDPGWAMATAACPIRNMRDLEARTVVKVVLAQDGGALFLKRLVQEKPCALEKTESLEQLRALYIGGRIAVIQTEELGVGVDTPEDVAVVEAIIRKQTI
jgi:3-deoxy-manno-octulosonate cytidylyltransferase (CMP-KDO synthetase)